MEENKEREKLIGLIARFAVDHNLVLPCASIADYLLANGVTLKSECEACGKAASDTIIGLQETIKELRATQQWIPVSERLPEKEGQYLIWTTIYFIPDHVDECNHYDGMELAYYDPDFGFMGHAARNAKAWTYLPKQPKEDE